MQDTFSKTVGAPFVLPTGTVLEALQVVYELIYYWVLQLPFDLPTGTVLEAL
jgi:hypothetical protein